MPAGLVKGKRDEEHWDEAKKAAAKEGHAGDWAYVTGIFKRMRGKKKPMHEESQAEYGSTKHERGEVKDMIAHAAKMRLGKKVK